ncbi:MAG TPA: HAMP domain-containing sensor histidine kinase, partial [Clostridiales bacterium]|nr:HAMP domain-containing sensor histidine kinase [Clostridiales bacterium]
DRKLPVTSNDEIGDLVVAFNKILELAKANIESIEQKQAILIERERLASLGQLIGGIAHNLRTPIMSISGAIEALKDLVYEYRDSIGDRSVNEQDHMEIAGEMLTWLDKMKPYCAYMSDVISAVKGQAVQMTASGTVRFTVDEAVKRVELLLKHELKRHHCVLNIMRNIDMRTEIRGEVSNLVQVLDNIIINAMQAYDGQAGTIDMEIVRSGDNVEFIIRDYGKGIPQNVANRLFREMITTKGKKGTGLGLYMSYSTIKGRFGGSITFTSKEGCGTTFFISIPCITNSGQEEYK